MQFWISVARLAIHPRPPWLLRCYEEINIHGLCLSMAHKFTREIDLHVNWYAEWFLGGWKGKWEYVDGRIIIRFVNYIISTTVVGTLREAAALEWVSGGMRINWIRGLSGTFISRYCGICCGFLGGRGREDLSSWTLGGGGGLKLN